MMTEDKIKWSYLAGIIDGEGSIFIHCDNRTWHAIKRAEDIPGKFYTLHITIANTNLRLMKWLVANFGGVYYAKPQVVPTWKIGYYWKPTGRKNQEHILLGTLPYLLLKRDQAKYGLEFIRLAGEKAPDKRETLYQACKILNRKGISLETNMSDTSQEVKIEPELTGDCESELEVIQVS